MIYYEYDRFGETESAVIAEYRNLHYPYLHFHRNYELVCLFSGSMRISLDGEEFTLGEGEFLLVQPNQVHSFTSLGNANARVCIFSPVLVNEFYQATLNLLPEKIVTRFKKDRADFIRENLRKDADKYLLKACLYTVCSEICRQTTFSSRKNPKDFVLIHQIITYIYRNFQNDVTLRNIAESMGYSYQYLSNYLHRYNLNFSALLNQYRLDYAKYLLKNSAYSITNVAFECGYNNVRTFNRNFLAAFKMTPKTYKKS